MREHVLDCALVHSPLRALGACNCSTLTSCVREKGGGHMEVGHGPLSRSTPHSIDRQILTHLHRNKILSQVEIPVYVST